MSRSRPYRGAEPVRKRLGTGGGHVSVYSDIEALIDDEEREIAEARAKASADHDSALATAEQEHADAYAAADTAFDAVSTSIENAYDAAQSPLDARYSGLEALRKQVVDLAGIAATPPPPPADPTTPVDPDPSQPSTPTSPEPEQDAPAASEEPTAPSDPSSPSTSTDPAPESPASPLSSLETDDSTPPTDSTSDAPSPTSSANTDEPQPIPVTSSADLRGMDDSQPVAVPLSTGEIRVVTAADVIAAKNPDLADDDLTEVQQTIRNSDLP